MKAPALLRRVLLALPLALAEDLSGGDSDGASFWSVADSSVASEASDVASTASGMASGATMSLFASRMATNLASGADSDLGSSLGGGAGIVVASAAASAVAADSDGDDQPLLPFAAAGPPKAGDDADQPLLPFAALRGQAPSTTAAVAVSLKHFSRRTGKRHKRLAQAIEAREERDAASQPAPASTTTVQEEVATTTSAQEPATPALRAAARTTMTITTTAALPDWQSTFDLEEPLIPTTASSQEPVTTSLRAAPRTTTAAALAPATPAAAAAQEPSWKLHHRHLKDMLKHLHSQTSDDPVPQVRFHAESTTAAKDAHAAQAPAPAARLEPVPGAPAAVAPEERPRVADGDGGAPEKVDVQEEPTQQPSDLRADVLLSAQDKLNQAALERMYDDILPASYRREIKPVLANGATAMDVHIDVHFQRINGLDIDANVLTLFAELSATWPDARLLYESRSLPMKWNSSSDALPVEPGKVWVPDVVIANEAEAHGPCLEDASISVYDEHFLREHGWNVRARRPVTMRVKCPVDISKFPWDQQRCTVLFRSQSNAHWMHLKAPEYGVDRKPRCAETTGFKVLQVGMDQSTYESDGAFVQDQGPASQVEYFMDLERSSDFYVLNVVLPLHLMAFLSAGTLYVAPGVERVVFGATMVLTVMSITFFSANYLPKTGQETWLEAYEIQTYIIVLTPLFYAIFSEMARRILMRPDHSGAKTDDDEAWGRKVNVGVERADVLARVPFVLWNTYYNSMKVRMTLEEHGYDPENTPLMLKMYLVVITFVMVGFIIWDCYKFPRH